MPSWRCRLCPQSLNPLPSQEAMQAHIEAQHLITVDSYLRVTQQSGLTPTLEPGERPPEQPTDEEMALLRKYTDQGLDPEDPRLQRVCFIQATVQRIEAETRGTPSVGQISMDRLTSLRPLIKESRDTISELLREKQRGEGEQKSESMYSDLMSDAEQYIKANVGDFQFRCGNCNQWVNTDGLPVWMLIQEPDPQHPGRTTAYVGNQEIFYLIRKGLLPLAHAAFLLRTSPEGLGWTAERRGHPMFQDESEALKQYQSAEFELRGLRRDFDEEAEDHAPS